MIPRLIVIALLLFTTIVSAEDKMSNFNIGMTVIKVPITQTSMDHAASYLRERTQALGIQQIAYSPLHQGYEALGLSNIRRTEIFHFCDASVAKALIEHDMRLAAFMPCRVALIEDEQGKAWFVMTNPNIFKTAMAAIPPDIRKNAKICHHLLTIIGTSPAAFSANVPAIDIAQSVVKMPIVEDISIDDAIDSLKLRANDLNVKLVGQQILTKEYQKLGLPDIRRTEIFQFCDTRVGKKMLDNDISYVAYMPCRIVLVEDKQGKGWFVMMNMDMFIALGKLPPSLKKQAVNLRNKLMEIIEAGANGDL